MAYSSESGITELTGSVAGLIAWTVGYGEDAAETGNLAMMENAARSAKGVG